MSDELNLPKKAKGTRPQFFDDPAIDRLVAIVTALAGEVSVLHDQLDTLIRVADEKGVITKSDLADFNVDGDVRAEREAWRDDFLGNVFRIVQQDVEGMEDQAKANADYEKIISEVEAN